MNMVLLESLKIQMGQPAEDFSLPGIDGKTYGLASFDHAKVLVIVFMCNHCPYVQAIWPRLIYLQERFKVEGVQFVGINSNVGHPDYEEETFEQMKEYYERYKMNFPYLADETQEVAKAFKAQCTPDIYVFDSERNLAYHGRVDDSWKDQNLVKKEELAQALSTILEGGERNYAQSPSMGCSIKWKD